jgi:hypothetical protein
MFWRIGASSSSDGVGSYSSKGFHEHGDLEAKVGDLRINT